MTTLILRFRRAISTLFLMMMSAHVVGRWTSWRASSTDSIDPVNHYTCHFGSPQDVPGPARVFYAAAARAELGPFPLGSCPATRSQLASQGVR
ncbi:hypothetical protein B0H21DRAFT_724271 [Amylocystis lapponica]|nr:hypothetical protein B0H21DRAFT_724271 [Amylocystis lapponica]